MNKIKNTVYLLIVTLLASCSNAVTQQRTISDKNSAQNVEFNLEERESWELPSELDEISGHTFLPGDDQVLYTIQDEKGILYAYDLISKKLINQISFGPDADYEGIATDGQYFYVLQSNGTIYSFPASLSGNSVQATVSEKLVEKGEYESLAYDKTNNKLVVFCKECKGDRKKKQTTGYVISVLTGGNLSLDRVVALDMNKLLELDARFPKTFNASALTLRPKDQNWYILSSIDKMIVVANKDFVPIAIMPFSRKLYEQPEGIFFDSQDNMFISSEKGDEKSAMIYNVSK